jgi:hypothetical protein
MSWVKGRLVLLVAALIASQGFFSPAFADKAKQRRAGAGKALSVMFDTSTGSRVKARSLMQRTFFDSIGDRDKPLQVAFVIDATDSMGLDVSSVMDSLNGIVETLRRHKSDPSLLSFGLVVFRDAKAPSGKIEYPLGKGFSSDTEELKTALSEVRTETGAPWFEEPVDLAMHEAMTELDWRDPDKAVRWVVVFSDASPYQEGYSDDRGGERTYSDEELLAKAKESSTFFHTVLCSSGYLFDATDEVEDTELKSPIDSEEGLDPKTPADDAKPTDDSKPADDFEPADDAKPTDDSEPADDENTNPLKIIAADAEEKPTDADNQARLEKLQKAYNLSLKTTQKFMEKMASQTGGVFLDLSDEKLRDTLVEQAKRRPVDYQAIDVITPADIQAARDKQSDEVSASNAVPVRLAVLPHLAMGKMSFKDTDPAVQVATLLRDKFRSLPRFEVTDSLEVQKNFEGLNNLIGKSSTEDQVLLQKLASDLQVDFVIWGDYLTKGKEVSLTSALYKRVDGTKLTQSEKVMSSSESVAADNQLGLNNLVLTVAEKLCQQAHAAIKASTPVSKNMLTAFAYVSTDKKAAQAFVAPLSNNTRASREILAGLGSLEKALAYQQGSPEALPFLEQATLRFGAAAQLDADNPLVHAWLASVYFNLGSESASPEMAEKYKAALEKAYQFRATATDPSFPTLIEAQYALIIEKDGVKAAGLYESLLMEPATKPLDITLKTHWMLAGIYAGDWGVNASVVSPEKARDHVIAILAQWPDSSEALYFTRALRWDKEDGSQHPFVPHENSPVVDSVAKLDPK